MQINTNAEVGYVMIKMLLKEKLTCDEVALICNIPEGITKVEDKLSDIVFGYPVRLLIIEFNGHFFQLKYTIDTSYANDANVYRGQIAIEMFEHEKIKVTKFYTDEAIFENEQQGESSKLANNKIVLNELIKKYKNLHKGGTKDAK